MLLGHKLLVKSFKSLAENNRLSHGYLFFGPEGVGKKLFALSLANFLSSRGGSSFGGEIIDGGIISDAILIEPNESKTIGIDAVREIKNFLYSRPNVSSKRTVIIDEAEFLTTEAQNAILKITEEPPTSSLLILICREPEILMPTLSSRLQKIYFSALVQQEVNDWLKSQNIKHVACSTKEIEEIAKKSMGSLGLALKMMNDEKFKETSKLAERFLKLEGAEKKDFLKNLLEPENFDILAFLDIIVVILASELRKCGNLRNCEKEISLWHRVLKLRRDFSNFPLNPKLQLLSLR